MNRVYWVLLGTLKATYDVMHQDMETGEIFRKTGELARNPGEWLLAKALEVIRTRGDRPLNVIPRSFRDAGYELFWVVTEPIAEAAKPVNMGSGRRCSEPGVVF